MRRLMAAGCGRPIRENEAPVQSLLRTGFVSRRRELSEWRQAGDPVLPSSFCDCWRWCDQ